MSVSFPSITIAICTYNRSASLTRTLERLCLLRVDENLRWKVLVVDNNSTDATEAAVAEFSDRLPIHSVRESNQGLSYARNRAVQECSTDLLLFTDDDVLLDREWLMAYASAAVGFPDAGFFGGQVVPYWVSGRPRWFREETLAAFGGLLVTYTLGDETRLYTTEESPPIGASFGFRREVLANLGPFRVDLGARGNRRGSGEDSEMLRRARRQGIVGVYVGSAICQHCVEKARTTCWHAFQYGYHRGQDEVAMGSAARGHASRRRAVFHLLRASYQAIKLRGDRVRLCLRNAGLEFGRLTAIQERNHTTVRS